MQVYQAEEVGLKNSVVVLVCVLEPVWLIVSSSVVFFSFLL